MRKALGSPRGKPPARCRNCTRRLRERPERELSLARLHGRTGGRTARLPEALYLSEGTVKQYINRIYSKLQLTGSAQEKRRALIALFENY